MNNNTTNGTTTNEPSEGSEIDKAREKMVRLLKIEGVISPKSITRVIDNAILKDKNVATALIEFCENTIETLSSQNDRAPKVAWFNEIKKVERKFILYPYIGHGSLTTLVGAGSAGKGTWCMFLLFLASKGLLHTIAPTDFRDPITSLYLSKEDDPAEKCAPELNLYGADMSKIAFCNELKDGSGFTFADPKVFKKLLRDVNPQLVVIDNAGDFGDRGNDGNNYKQVNAELSMLKNLSEGFDIDGTSNPIVGTGKYRCGCILIVHENKAGGFMGSMAYKTKPRSMLTMKRTTETNQTMLQVGKSNVNVGDALIFNAREVQVVGDTYPIWQVSYGGKATPEQVATIEGKDYKKQDVLQQWLYAYLRANGDSHPKVIKGAANVYFSSNDQFKKNGQVFINTNEWARVKEKTKITENQAGFWCLAPNAKDLGDGMAQEDDGDDAAE